MRISWPPSRWWRDVGFDQSFSFLYSRRPGTPAASLPDEVPHEVKQQRLELLQQRLNGQARAISQRMVGSRSGCWSSARQAKSASNSPAAPTTTAGSISMARRTSRSGSSINLPRCHHRSHAEFPARAPRGRSLLVSSVPMTRDLCSRRPTISAWSSCADRWISTFIKSRRGSVWKCGGAAIDFKSSGPCRYQAGGNRAAGFIHPGAARTGGFGARAHCPTGVGYGAWRSERGASSRSGRESEARRAERRTQGAHGARRGARPRPNQTEYLTNVRTHDLTFGIGPAGTGKTYLAVACAVEALQSESVRRIMLVRPAVEAGERWVSAGRLVAEGRSVPASHV
jgi:hypothetical protein